MGSRIPRLALSTRIAPRAIVPVASSFVRPSVGYTAARYFHSTKMASYPIATLDASLVPRLPPSSPTLFEAKKKKNLSFEAIAKEVGREEVAIAAMFYGQAQASPEDIKKLSQVLDIPVETLESQLSGYAYKAVLNEKFGDGIMSAISFSTKVEKETDEKGDWAVITLRGKWLPYSRF